MARRRSLVTEAEVLRTCLAYLGHAGIPAWRNNTGALRVGRRLVRFGTLGSSDILGILPPSGRMLVCECKRPGGRPTTLQAAFLVNIAAAGGLAVVAHGVDELQAALREAGLQVP